MALTAAQIVTVATQIAKVPGYTAQAGAFLNSILSDLNQTYDLAAALETTRTLTLNPGSGQSPGAGSGPYTLPDDYLRMAFRGFFYYVNQVPYILVSIELSEYNALVQQAGISNYPENFTTILEPTPKQLFVWPPSGGVYVCTMQYYKQMPDIVTPETSTDVPWFPNQNYLITRLAGELMKLANDDRWQAFLGDGPSGAQGILDRYLKLQEDNEGRVDTVKLDRRMFGAPFSRLPNTKTLGW